MHELFWAARGDVLVLVIVECESAMLACEQEVIDVEARADPYGEFIEVVLLPGKISELGLLLLLNTERPLHVPLSQLGELRLSRGNGL